MKYVLFRIFFILEFSIQFYSIIKLNVANFLFLLDNGYLIHLNLDYPNSFSIRYIQFKSNIYWTGGNSNLIIFNPNCMNQTGFELPNRIYFIFEGYWSNLYGQKSCDENTLSISYIASLFCDIFLFSIS